MKLNWFFKKPSKDSWNIKCMSELTNKTMFILHNNAEFHYDHFKNWKSQVVIYIYFLGCIYNWLSAGHTTQNNSWMTCLTAELSNFPPSSHLPTHNGSRLQLLRCRLHQSEEQRSPAIPKAKLVTKNPVSNIDSDLLPYQRSHRLPEIQATKVKRPMRKQKSKNKIPI